VSRGINSAATEDTEKGARLDEYLAADEPSPGRS
jgi:hypothetical protein